ncbi:DUF2834 domain-containing protein [Acaryochloris thomasi]|nr:DUF2834 domain-containing protein [Acaryochloris thomasi]
MNISTQQRSQSQGLSKIYLIFIILSLVISWGIFLQFLLSGEASVSLFFEQALATPVSRLLSSDIAISAFIFFIFAYVELKRFQMPSNLLVIYILGTFSVGICFGLSLFLYQRETWFKHSQPQ